ncbi:ribosomal protein S18 acetylase RimI-like enzyme [Aquimarina sp. EL_43]|uniref:GNAT family N-acetyltransferase n=1 Tax=Aquimarina TaxID=290174 RepID=UPI00046F2796|nr:MULTISPECIES: GNAT family N-acetyltransferase [Aquimarina]MBG6133105.1 ribosomal protein S18 acetylase RimI-like enzyme [Aquimarina sp. EL_35]MBG6153263.1 ribosomal protein S18 acetylase RimI-like enzyme [Aquimarina sp. EL_32]MBG6171468.1 ribosomal protein S18 acetylase RimI-like enzyme [Aquimarina sp. EL_43]
MEKLELIKAQESDKDFLFKLRKATMVEHLEEMGIFLSDEEHLSRIDFQYDNAYVILKSNQRAGVLKYIETEHAIEILQIQVLPEYQGHGIGKYVIKDLIETAKASNKDMVLKVLKENPARYLYERMGFKTVDEDKYEFHMQLASNKG